MEYKLQRAFYFFKQSIFDFLKRIPFLYRTYKKVQEKKEKEKVNSLIEKKIEIIIYFPGTLELFDEFKQWNNLFNLLSKEYSVVILVRNKEVEKYLNKNSGFNVYCATTLNKLLLFYEQISPKLIFYTGHNYKNFQSLIYNDSLHIYLSNPHIECNNQVKAYDFVYISGQYELDRYLDRVIRIDDDRFVQIGRPMLDLIQPLYLNTKNKKVVLYVPDLSFYDDLKYIRDIIDTILNMEDILLIYMPKNQEFKNETLNAQHQDIIQNIKLKQSFFLQDKNHNTIYPLVDLAIFDTFDYDYLFINKPYLMSKIGKQQIQDSIKINNELDLLNIEKCIIDEIKFDFAKDLRKELRKYYMNDYQKGESVKKLFDSIQECIKFRDFEMKNKQERLCG